MSARPLRAAGCWCGSTRPICPTHGPFGPVTATVIAVLLLAGCSPNQQPAPTPTVTIRTDGDGDDLGGMTGGTP